MQIAPGASAEHGACIGMTVGSGQERPSSRERVKTSSFCFIPEFSSRQKDSPGASIGVRMAWKKSSSAGDAQIEPAIEYCDRHCGQIGPSCDQVLPPSFDRLNTATKSFVPSSFVNA